jgi:hypothetical protein
MKNTTTKMPIKSYKSIYSDSLIANIFFILLEFVMLVSGYLLIKISKELNVYAIVICTIAYILLAVSILYLHTWKMEIYEKFFLFCLNIPFKIIYKKYSFDEIEWIDGEKIEGHTRYVSGIFHNIKIHLRNGSLKVHGFLGNENDLIKIIGPPGFIKEKSKGHLDKL